MKKSLTFKSPNCPFCLLGLGLETPHNKLTDVIYEDKLAQMLISPTWWPKNPGHVLITPKKHIENIYSIDDKTLAHLFKLSKLASIALKQVYQCDGTSLRQHNEKAGNQTLFHFHIHVFPRYFNDNLYENIVDGVNTTPQQRLPYADKLRKYLQTN